ncbi:DUF3987 domain-containing protein [Ketogulonicigenium vulgare]|uniref:DUF3987 domain-containing protein n=1 Tax=Ketogulonicigenium vulgare TaxID=92945 RepID=UPI00235930E3|nr:DUF3987 domain-containing protein [Ketogulonicigenium vulgare]
MPNTATNIVTLPTKPRPLVPAATHAAPYPVKYLGPLAEIAKAASTLTHAPVHLSAQCALGYAALAVQGLANVETVNGYSPISLFFLTVGVSGERKSSTEKALLDKELIADQIVTDPSVDGFFNLFEDRSCAGLFSDESGSFLNGYAMNKTRSGRTYATMNSLWDGSQISKQRAKEKSVVRHRRISMHLMAQPDVANLLLTDKSAKDIGFLARVLFVAPESAIGHRPVKFGNTTRPQDLMFFEMRINKLLSLPLPTVNDESHELTPRKLALSDQAKRMVEIVGQRIENQQAAGGRYETVRSFASKTIEQACRIAAVLTLYRDHEAYEIEQKDMKRGLALATYYLEEALRIMGRTSVDAELLQADKLRQWLQDANKRQFVTRDIQQYGPRETRQSAPKLLAILQDYGWVRPLPAGTVIDGLPRKTAWAAYW